MILTAGSAATARRGQWPFLLFLFHFTTVKSCHLEYGGAWFTGNDINTQLNIPGIAYYSSSQHQSGLETLVLNPSTSSTMMIPPPSGVFFCDRVECSTVACMSLTDGIEGASFIVNCDDAANDDGKCTTPTLEPTSVSPSTSPLKKGKNDHDSNGSNDTCSKKTAKKGQNEKCRKPAGKKKSEQMSS